MPELVPEPATGVRRHLRTAAWLPVGLLLAAVFHLGAGRADGPPEDAAAFGARVNRAIDQGVLWFRAWQQDNGAFPLGQAPRDFPFGEMGDPSSKWAGGPWDKGAEALAVLTLVACDVPRTDPAVDRGFKRLRAHWDGRKKNERPFGADDGISTYFVALCLLALDAAHDTASLPLHPSAADKKAKKRAPLAPQDRAWAVELVAWLGDAQDAGAGSEPDEPPDPFAPPPAGKKKPKERPKTPPPLPSGPPAPEDGGGFGYSSPSMPNGYHDHSNSQYAALGLKSAARLGVPVPDVVWIRLLRHFLAVQEGDGPEVERLEVPGARAPAVTPGEGKTVAPETSKDRARGWRYMCANSGRLEGADGVAGSDEATLAMTAGGASTLVIARSELLGHKAFTAELRALTEKGIRDGFAWIAHHLPAPYGKAASDPQPALPPGGKLPAGFDLGDELDDFYFLYGLERACILGGVKTLGDLDWYRIGATRILERQKEDGSFLSKNRNNANGRPLIDSCFALLFLKRSLFRLPAPAITEPTGPPAEPGKGPAGR